MVEGARLESEYTPKAYRGFESLPLRQLFDREFVVGGIRGDPSGYLGAGKRESFKYGSGLDAVSGLGRRCLSAIGKTASSGFVSGNM